MSFKIPPYNSQGTGTLGCFYSDGKIRSSTLAAGQRENMPKTGKVLPDELGQSSTPADLYLCRSALSLFQRTAWRTREGSGESGPNPSAHHGWSSEGLNRPRTCWGRIIFWLRSGFVEKEISWWNWKLWKLNVRLYEDILFNWTNLCC